MPELPDITVYVEALAARIVGRPIIAVRLGSPFLLRTVVPPVGAFQGLAVTSVARSGKRIVIGCTQDYYLIIHLMIAGRLHWRRPGAGVGAKNALLAVDFDTGALVLTEAGAKRRAALHACHGAAAVGKLDRGGIEVASATVAEFATVLRRANHTLKRALTDPGIVSGIGNAYSDEILFQARMSPFKLTTHLRAEEFDRLHQATVSVLDGWTERLRAAAAGRFPEQVTAFRPEMAVHGRYRQPCRVCGAPIQRIVYAENECNYCARCQTAGQVLADRSLSRLLKSNWPRTLEELEQRDERRANDPIQDGNDDGARQ